MLAIKTYIRGLRKYCIWTSGCFWTSRCIILNRYFKIIIHSYIIKFNSIKINVLPAFRNCYVDFTAPSSVQKQAIFSSLYELIT